MTISLIYPVLNEPLLPRQNLPLNTLRRNVLDKDLAGKWMVENSVHDVECRLVLSTVWALAGIFAQTKETQATQCGNPEQCPRVRAEVNRGMI